MWATLAAQVAGVPTESDCGVVVWPEKARATVAIGSAAVVVAVVAAAEVVVVEEEEVEEQVVVVVVGRWPQRWRWLWRWR